jgi:hypothetical protein
MDGRPDLVRHNRLLRVASQLPPAAGAGATRAATICMSPKITSAGARRPLVASPIGVPPLLLLLPAAATSAVRRRSHISKLAGASLDRPARLGEPARRERPNWSVKKRNQSIRRALTVSRVDISRRRRRLFE